MTDIKQIPIRHIHLGAESQTLAAGTAPLFPDDGKTRINQYVDADKNGSLDYVVMTGSSKTSKILITNEFQKSTRYPSILRDYAGWKRAYVAGSPYVQEQFTIQLSAATKTYGEFETALKQNLVKDGPAPQTYRFKDSQGSELSVDNVRAQRIDGKLRVIGLTIGKEDGTQITVDDQSCFSASKLNWIADSLLRTTVTPPLRVRRTGPIESAVTDFIRAAILPEDE